MAATVPAAALRDALLAKREIALLDVREEDPHAQEHPLFAANMPLSRLEIDIYTLLPRRDVFIVLIDAGEGLAARAATKLESLGYTNVARLAGGLQGWKDAGFEIFRDVNVPSKSFGEFVEAKRHTPSLPAEEVKALLDKGADIIVLDSRPFEEYTTMSIPTGINVPGGELVYRVNDLVVSDKTTVIVNCAGRTRSLIGTQSLVNGGLKNPVHALRNGTIGWTLAGLTLEKGQTRRFKPERPQKTASPEYPRSCDKAMDTETIDGPGCTNADGMKSLISEPWAVMALANTASSSAALSFTPRIVTAFFAVPSDCESANFRPKMDG